MIYADSSFLVRLVTREPGSEAVVAQYRRLGRPRLAFASLHEMEVRNGLRLKAFLQMQSNPAAKKSRLTEQLAAWEAHRLTTTPLRETLDRQTGMYRAAAKISDDEIDALVGRLCRSQGGAPGCLRTILWARDATGARPSLRLPLDKFIAPLDQTGRGENVMPLLCQEACNLLVAEARKVVRESSPPGTDE